MIFMEDIGFDIDERILRVLNGVASSREKASLDEWFQSSVEHEDYYRERVRDFQRIKMLVNITRAEDMKQQVCKTLNKAVRKQTKAKIRMSRRGWYKIAGMAAILIVGFMVRFHDKNTSHDHLLKQPIIYPGKSVATITLANGEELEVGNRGLNVREENGMFLKLDSTVITYSGKQADSGKVVYNTLTVPAGGEYRLVLSDGTKVWMNAESVVRFPVVFPTGERRVACDGEVFFDVARDSLRPFRVETAGNVVKVLGTRFDIRHYEDEPYSAVLLSGSIRLSRGKHEVLLKPGEQAQLMEERWVVGKAGASATSWIDGYFLFDNRSLEYIMRELARWYDIEVFFVDSDKQNEYYSFEIERSSSLKQVMNILEKTRTLDIELKGRTVIIR